MKFLGNENPGLDAVDLKLLRLLEKDARTSTAELARSVGLSAPSVAERIRRLQENGVIEAYTVRINPASLGLPLSAWLRIRPVPGQLGAVAEILRGLPEISQCDRVTGEDCFIALVHVASVGELERVIDRIIPYAMTNTAIIQSSPVAPRSALAAARDAKR
jgi:Lrp/AsnC family leucine-responsive transcriptional regulator